jgi:hypothetical protein
LLLGLAQPRDRQSERDQVADERQGSQVRIAIRLSHAAVATGCLGVHPQTFGSGSPEA